MDDNTHRSRKLRRLWSSVWAAWGLAGVAWTQGMVGSAEGQSFLGYRRSEVWANPGLWATSGSASAGSLRPRLGAAELGALRFDVGEEAEELAARLGVEPPPVSREALEGTSEKLQRFHGLPGGIVLGLEARAVGQLARTCAGARVEGGLADRIVLRLADGRELRSPAIQPETLRALLAFSGGSRDALVDLHGPESDARLAPAFAGSRLGEELARLDRLPHRLLPETRAWKTLIVDRAVRLEAREDELVLTADLEVRLYGEELGSGWAARASVVDAAGADFVGPRRSGDLGAELAPLAQIAAWLGFLRWVERLDPRGIAELRAR